MINGFDSIVVKCYDRDVKRGKKTTVMDNNGVSRKAEISLRIMEFQVDESELSSVDDALIIGKKAPVGTDAAKKLAEIVSPGKYEVIKAEHTSIDAVIIRKTLLSMVQRDKLIPLIIEECGKIIHDTVVLKAQVLVIIHINRIIDI